ncbi:MAG: four helix bundle protein [Candidatus Omnitrophota bacterium]
MENNNTAQRSINNAQRNGYLFNDARRRGNGGFPPKSEKQLPRDGDQGSGTAVVPSPDVSQKEIKTFRNLAIWQKGIALVKAIYQKTSGFPRDELYGIVGQMRRAAVSIPSNIAEGYRRRHAKEFQPFLNIALGSLGELETQITVSDELNYFSDKDGVFLLEEVDHLTRMIISLSKKVEC